MTCLEVIGIPCFLLDGNVTSNLFDCNKPLSSVLPCERLHTLELREFGDCEYPQAIQQALRALMNDVRFYMLNRIELPTENADHPDSEYPREMLPPGWIATTIDKSRHKYKALFVLTRTGT
jgi:hypothetical protein